MLAAAAIGCSGSSTSPMGAPAAAGAADGTTAPSDPVATGGNGTTTPDPTPAPDPTAGGAGTTSTPTPAPKPMSHHHCAWLNDDVALGTASLIANADFFDVVHPYFWTLTAGGSVTTTSFTDDTTIVSTAHTHSIKLMPLVYGGDDASVIRSVIDSPSAITAHANTLVNLAVTHNYDGIELDYDFHGLGSPHMGPLAPLGWIDAVDARVQQLGIADHYVLGIANYGVGNGWYANSADLVKECGAGYPTTTDHMASCSFGVYTAGISPHCTTSRGDVWFEDANSIAEKAKSAKAHGLRGVSYYTLGGEAPGLIDALRAAYP